MATDEPLSNYLDCHVEEIIRWINDKVITTFRPTGEIYDRLANQVVRDYHYGQGIDNAHRFLTTAIVGALWCGWFSQSRSNRNDPQFGPENVERFRAIIADAFEIGRRNAERNQ
jgi:hypothetical protein